MDVDEGSRLDHPIHKMAEKRPRPSLQRVDDGFEASALSPPSTGETAQDVQSDAAPESAKEEEVTTALYDDIVIGKPILSSTETKVILTQSQSTSSSEDDEEDTALFLNEFDNSVAVDEAEGVSLLRQIFPEEPVAVLKQMHRDRIQSPRGTPKTPVPAEANDFREDQHIPTGSFQTPQTDNTSRRILPETQVQTTLRSKLARRILQQERNEIHWTADPVSSDSYWQSSSPLALAIADECRAAAAATLLPHDFLRLPPQIAIRRWDKDQRKWHYQVTKDLALLALRQHNNYVSAQAAQRGSAGGVFLQERAYTRLDDNDVDGLYYTRAMFRDAKVGLGISLCETKDGVIQVHSLTTRDGKSWLTSPRRTQEDSGSGRGLTSADSNVLVDAPSVQAGIEPGDVLIGINGVALLHSLPNPVDSLLRHAVTTIQLSADPVVLHLQRAVRAHDHTTGTGEARHGESNHFLKTPSLVAFDSNAYAEDNALLDTTDTLEESRSVEVSFHEDRTFHSTPMIDDVAGIPLVHPFVATLRAHDLLRSYEDERNSTLMLRQYTERIRQWEATSSFHIQTHPASQAAGQVFIPLMGVRKALSVRILNSFLDSGTSAYTIWVYDVESGREWYAPVRYYEDFQDLRSATMRLNPTIGQISFPKQPLSLFGSPVRQESEAERDSKCRQLEKFLRVLCSMIYRSRLHPAVAEIAVHVQSFLGCEEQNLFLDDDPNSTSFQNECFGGEEGVNPRVRYILKRSLQMYTYRIFLLDPVSTLVDTFVNSVRARGPRLQELEALEAQGRSAVKARAMTDLEQMKSFLDKMQELILEGCMDDFRSIAEREDYEAIHSNLEGKKGASYWDRLVREAVREQVEIEVYVPLRSVVSRWLVKGWRHEDMEVSFKMKELRRRPQSSFRIRPERISPSSWFSVSRILKEGVGMSTLPCAKLRAIVEAAREISRLYATEQRDSLTIRISRDANDDDDDNSSTASSKDDGDDEHGHHLGADDFLPIFIYCVVQADMERPCALCVLLRTLCDPINRLGEIGYYLASFEAAISHIQEWDLTEDRDELFLSVPLVN